MALYSRSEEGKGGFVSGDVLKGERVVLLSWTYFYIM